MNSLKPAEARILKVVIESGKYLSTRQIALKAIVSWNTAKKYLDEFHEKEWIKHKKRWEKGKIDLWKANPLKDRKRNVANKNV